MCGWNVRSVWKWESKHSIWPISSLDEIPARRLLEWFLTISSPSWSNELPRPQQPQQYLRSKTASMGVFPNRKVSLSPTELRRLYSQSEGTRLHTFPILFNFWVDLCFRCARFTRCGSFLPGVGQRCACLSSEHTGGEVVLHCLCSVHAKDVYDSQGMWQF